MRVLALLTLAPGHAPAELGPHLVPENRAVWDLYVRGLVRAMYGAHRAGGPPGAALELEAASLADARQTVDALPMVAAGLLTVDVIALEPFRSLEAVFAAPSTVA